MEAQHQNVVKELKHGRLDKPDEEGPPATGFNALDKETDALEHAVSLLGGGNFEKATSSLRAVLETYPNCSEARELLEVAYKASSGTRLSVDLGEALKRGTEAFASGRQRDAIESWKQCLIEEPGNRLLQLLVMLATTWSQERRQHYANEVLAAGSASLSEGRPEEAQALLLIAQTVEGAGSGPPPPSAAPTPAPADPLSALEPGPDASAGARASRGRRHRESGSARARRIGNDGHHQRSSDDGRARSAGIRTTPGAHTCSSRAGRRSTTTAAGAATATGAVAARVRDTSGDPRGRRDAGARPGGLPPRAPDSGYSRRTATG